MVRVLAWRLLRSGSPTPLRDVAECAAREGLDARDRGLLRRLVATELRRRATLAALSRHFAGRTFDPDLAVHLRLGLVQAFFLDRVPDHAVVS